MARTMLMQEMMSMVMPQKWRNPMMSVRVRMIARITRMQILGKLRLQEDLKLS